MMIAKEELQLKIRDSVIQNNDLPTLTCEINLAREKKTSSTESSLEGYLV